MQNKKNENKQRSYFGLLVGLLQIAFIVLKLCGVIGWSWWRVLSPLWAYLFIIVVLGVLIGAIDAMKIIRARKAREALTKRVNEINERK